MISLLSALLYLFENFKILILLSFLSGVTFIAQSLWLFLTKLVLIFNTSFTVCELPNPGKAKYCKFCGTLDGELLL